MTTEQSQFKSGLVALIGRSNVGKSTLLNTLVGTKISATSFRPQMTRQIIHGVLNLKEGQAVFVDTPGFLKTKRSLLSAKLLNTVKESIKGIDLIIYVADPTREIGDEERASLSLVRYLDTPKILAINKSDLPTSARKYQADYEKLSENFNFTVNVSAIRNTNIQLLKDKVMEFLPIAEPLYPEWQLTNINKDFWIAEIIREKVFSVLEKEVPYSLTVDVTEVEEKKDILVIKADILTNDLRYKKIIIGSGGQKIKEIGQMARKELEQAANKKIFLDLNVAVDKHWIERI